MLETASIYELFTAMTTKVSNTNLQINKSLSSKQPDDHICGRTNKSNDWKVKDQMTYLVKKNTLDSQASPATEKRMKAM